VKKLRKEARRDDENELKHFKQEVRLLKYATTTAPPLFVSSADRYN
jgi:hypothetical protein